MIEELNDRWILKKYFEIMAYRMAFSSIELENLANEENRYRSVNDIANQLEAIKYLFEEKENNVDFYDPMNFVQQMNKIVYLVTNSQYDNIRNCEIIINGSNVERSKPVSIRSHLYEALENYKYQLEHLPKEEYFEIEATFHIRLLKIHPYGDGNGRLTRLILIYNMLINDYAPAIIYPNDKPFYCEYIENDDIKSLAKMIEKSSNNELEQVKELYMKQLDKNDNEEIKIYKKKPKFL